MLAAHSRLSCGPETGFFAAFAASDVSELLRPAEWPEPAIDFLFSIEQGGQPVPSRYGLSREQVRGLLAQRRPAVQALLSVLTESHRREVGKARWIEKSPVHLAYGSAIRRYFPDSPIVRIVRDPRDVALSLLRVPWAPSSFAEALLYWRRFDERGLPFFSKGSGTWTIRYEDLLQSPQEVLEELCQFLGEAFEPGMLDYQSSAAHVTRPNETWKSGVGEPLDRSRVDVWRRELTPVQLREAYSILADRLGHYGYDLGVGPLPEEGFVEVHPLSEALSEYPAVLSGLLSQPVRLWRARAGEKPRATIYVGEPDSSDWLGPDRFGRFSRALGLVFRALSTRLAGRPVYWVSECPRWNTSGHCARLLSILLGPLAIRSTGSIRL